MTSSSIKKLFDSEPVRGNTIFHVLAELGSLELLYRIRDRVDEAFDSIVLKKNYNGETSIHVAAKKNKGQRAISIIQVLVEFGGDLNAADRYTGVTVLHEAVWREDYILAEWLCTQPDIDLEATTWGGLTAFQLAFKKRNDHLMNIFRTNGANCEDGVSSESDLD